MRTFEDIQIEIEKLYDKIYKLREELETMCNHPEYYRFEHPGLNKPEETIICYKCVECHKTIHFKEKQPEFESKLAF